MSLRDELPPSFGVVARGGAPCDRRVVITCSQLTRIAINPVPDTTSAQGPHVALEGGEARGAAGVGARHFSASLGSVSVWRAYCYGYFFLRRAQDFVP